MQTSDSAERPPARAWCIGHAAYDLCTSVAAYPAANAKTQTELLLESGGGPAANAAWLLARWGVPTALAAVVGDDDYGRRVMAELRAGGVDCALMEMRGGHVTPVSFIIVSQTDGSRTIINRRVPAQPLRLPPAALSGPAPSLLLFDGHELEASLAAMVAFPSAITVLDAGSLRQGTETLARRVQYLVCSERFASQITGLDDVEGQWEACLRQLRALNRRVVVVTLGERGLIFSDGPQHGRLPALPVETVDTTAAGDIFHGAFAYALLQGMDLSAALRLATAAAGLSVERPGGRPSTPELGDVRQALGKL
jgi:sugar/nucleoside kinase (ribokinase family)